MALALVGLGGEAALAQAKRPTRTTLRLCRAAGRRIAGFGGSLRVASNGRQAAGQDEPIDPKTASYIIDHGDMTPEQSRRYEAAQSRAAFPRDETSGLERTHCVAGHIELTERIFGQGVGRKAGEGLHPHAMPQDLVGRMEGVRTEPDAPGKPPRS